MNVLFLTRNPNPGLAKYARELAAEIENLGHHVDFEDGEWIPNETGPRVDKEVSPRLQRRAGPYDIVHAFGYRTAWACAEAFGSKEAWVYTAHDMPKSTHRLLITRLNDAQVGFCSSRAVYRMLDESLAIDITTVYPGIKLRAKDEIDRTATRAMWGYGPEDMVIAAHARFVPDRGIRPLIDAMPEVWELHPNARLIVSGDGEEDGDYRSLARMHDPDGNRIQFIHHLHHPEPLFVGADLFVVPSHNAGFSMTALESMSAGCPTLVRHSGGLSEIVDPDVSGFIFKDDEELVSQLKELLGLPMTLETVGHGGKVRVLERFTIEKSAQSVFEGYANATGLA